MIKIIMIVLLTFILAFFLEDSQYHIFVKALGYEYSFSLFLLFGIGVLFLYILHLAYRPLHWLSSLKHKKLLTQTTQKHDFLLQVLSSFLEQNTYQSMKLLKKATSDSQIDLLTQALLNPNEKIFQKMLLSQETLLIGLKGLYFKAKEKQDWILCNQYIEKIKTNFQTLAWVFQEDFELQCILKNWDIASISLEKLRKNFDLPKEEYKEKKAFILQQQDYFKEAFELQPDNTQIALGYAKQNPKKAKTILEKNFSFNPSWEIYLAYKELITQEKPIKQIKFISELTDKYPTHKITFLAKADIAVSCQLWGMAKGFLEEYLNYYDLTPQIALLMADAERYGWNHQEEAKKWEEKALSLSLL